MRVMPLAYHEISFADTSSTEGKNFLELRHLAYQFNATGWKPCRPEQPGWLFSDTLIGFKE